MTELKYQCKHAVCVSQKQGNLSRFALCLEVKVQYLAGDGMKSIVLNPLGKVLSMS
jgi:hypothetical protein